MFVGHAPRSRRIEVHAAQIEAIERFRVWMTDHMEGGATELDPRIREAIEQNLELDAELGALIGLSEMFLSGGRRSGKTVVMEGILNSYAVAVPDANVWTVVPSENFLGEPKRVNDKMLPSDWYEYRGDPNHTYYLANGSEHVIRSGFTAGSLKQGEAVLVGINEAQQVPADSYRNTLGATIDGGGFTIVAANPPTIGDVGTWVLDAVVDVQKGARPGAEHFFCDPLDNPHIVHAKLLALRSKMTQHDFDTQIRGKMLQNPNQVLYTWDRAVNERRAPDFGKITHEFLTAHEGDRAPWNALVTVDVQSFPFIACGVFDIYRDPREPQNPKAGLLWMRDEVALAQGDEVDACDELKRHGIDGKRTLVIMDASCWWQQCQRDLMAQRPEYKGKGSADIFKRCGFLHVVPPDRDMKRNPDVMERIRATNATIRPADDVRWLFIDAAKCPNAVESARTWRTKNGKPSRTAKAAHFGDVLGYAVWRFFPRRGVPSKLVDDALPPDAEALPRTRAEGYGEL